MTDTVKALAQADLTATTLTDVYTVPASTQVVISSVTVANRTGTDRLFRCSLAVNGAADANAQYLYYDQVVYANETFVFTIGVTLDAADVLRFKADSANALSINVFGVEIT